MKRVSLLTILILGAKMSLAQIPAGFVQTDATVTQIANAQMTASWTNLSSSSQLPLLGGVSVFPTSASARVDSNGHFSVLLADTAQIIPNPSTWKFNFVLNCPPSSSGPGGFFVEVAVTGGGSVQDISTQINAALPTAPCGSGGAGTITPSPQFSMFYQPNPGTAAAAIGDTHATTDGQGHIQAITATAGIVDKGVGGQIFNIKAYGAKGDAVTDDTAAIQAAIDTGAGSEVFAPPGKYRLCAPLHYYTPNAGRVSTPGVKIVGVGDYGASQFLPDPGCFTVPASIVVGGITVPVQPAVIDIQGTLSAANFAVFTYGVEINKIEIAPLGCETNPGGGEPGCSYLSAPISGVSWEGCWHCSSNNLTVNRMSGDGIVMPYASWIGIDPDWWASAYLTIEHLTATNNKGWGVNLAGFNAASDVKVEYSTILSNWTGGIRDTGWWDTFNYNGVAINGCGPTITGTSGSHVSCSTVPPGPGILADRAYGGGGPLSGKIEGNTMDSNAGGHILIRTGTNYKVLKNFLVAHTTAYVFNDTFPGALNVPGVSVVLGAGTGAVGTTLTENEQRSDFQCAGGFPIPTSGCGFGNAGLDPQVTSINFADANQSNAYANQNIFRLSNNSSNYVPYTSGNGAIAGYPLMNGGGTSVVSWSLLDGGIGIVTPPTIVVTGGDSAVLGSTLVTLTQVAGALSTCTIQQAGGPYNRAPLTSVLDNQPNPGSGGAFTLTLSGGATGTPTGCAISAAGSGYLHPLAGVTPQCATPPSITATSTLGIDFIRVGAGGNYGAWTPGSAAPTVTASITDATGVGYSISAVVRPVNTNTNPVTTPTVVWQVVGVDTLARGYSFTAPTVSFSSASTVTPATAVVTLGHVLNYPLTVGGGGTCDAGAPLGMIFQYANYPSSNNTNNLLVEQNVSVSSPPPGSVSQQTIGNLTLWGSSNQLRMEQGSVINSSTGPMSLIMYHDTNGTDSQGLTLDATSSIMQIYPSATGADTATGLLIFTKTAQPLELGTNNIVQAEMESTGDYIPTSGNTLPNLGNASFPWKILFSNNTVVKGTPNVTGCSVSAVTGGASAGKFTSGTTGTCTVTITPGITAPSDFTCTFEDRTTPADTLTFSSSSTTTYVAAGTTVSGDIIEYRCTAF